MIDGENGETAPLFGDPRPALCRASREILASGHARTGIHRSVLPMTCDLQMDQAA